MDDDRDHIRLNSLRFWGRHGHFPNEQDLGNRFEVDVDIELDANPAAELDRIDLTVDLSRVYDIVRRHVEGEPCQLLEALAGRIAAEVITLEKVEAVTLRVRKLMPPFPGSVQGVMEVEIRREAERDSGEPF